jgi:molecular chaperone DnaK (HSP70)
MAEDVPMQDYDDIRDFVVAIDFGTTFSSVAYVGYSTEDQRKRIGLQQIEIIDRYPYNYKDSNCYEVPTELWYSQRISRPMSLARSTVDRQPAGDDDVPESNGQQSSSTETSVPGVFDDTQLSPTSSHPEAKKEPVLWGYGVQDQLMEADYNTEHSKHMTRFKLILDKSTHTENIRTSLSNSCNMLKKNLLINEDTDLIADYLTQLLRHTKTRLVESEGYTDASKLEFVLCVPAVWSPEAIRQMEAALATAVKEASLGKLQHGSIDNLFTVSEPEGAAVCVLARDRSRFKACT